MTPTSRLAVFKEWLQYLASRRVPKNNSIWVFGAIRGQLYADNAKYLFEYVNKNTDIQAIWITKKDQVVEQVRSRGFEAFHEDSREARYYIERAKVAVITHRGNRHLSDMPFQWMSKKTFIVQLWHGIPLKKIAFDDHHFSYKHDENTLIWKLKDILKRYLFPFRQFVNHPKLIPVSSEETKRLFSAAFRVPEDNVAITGHPRDDRVRDVAAASHAETIRRIVYMPTFRGEENSDFNLFERFNFSVEKVDKFLFEKDMQLDIKLHPFNYPSDEMLSSIGKAKYISLLDCEDIYDILNQYDALITDYSSIYFDFLMLNRPIIFAPFDKEEYLGSQRDFYFAYEEITPGPKAVSWPEVLEHITAFSKNPLWYSKERAGISERFHTIKHDSCERLYREIKGRVA